MKITLWRVSDRVTRRLTKVLVEIGGTQQGERYDVGEVSGVDGADCKRMRACAG